MTVEETIEDWIEKGMPCLGCGERVATEVTFHAEKSLLILRGVCDPCPVSPSGKNPMTVMIE